jgi:glycosyltransferase involved in cell wall biosynthesis
MAEQRRDRVALGVWVAWDFPVNFVGEGMSRLLAMLVEGAAQSGRVMLHVCVRPVNEAAARAMLEGLRAQEGVDWTLNVIEQVAAPAPFVPLESIRDAPPPPPAPELPPLAQRLAAMPDARIGIGVFAASVAALPLLVLRSLLRPLWRLALRSGLGLGVAALRDPVAAAPAVSVGLRRLRLPPFRRLAEGFDAWAEHRASQREAAGTGSLPEPRGARAVTGPAPTDAAPGCPSPMPAEPAPAQPSDRPWEVRSLDYGKVDAWLALMADMVLPATIPGRRAMLLPDALMLDFGSTWNAAHLVPAGFIAMWFSCAKRNIARSDAIITFSSHVARRHAVEALGADPEQLRVVPHAPPDLAPLLPFLPQGRRRSAESRAQAAAQLRRHAASRSWSYLADFPLEHVDYIAVSTQERPSKNLSLVIEALRILVHERFGTIKLLMTTELIDDPATPFLHSHALIREHGLMLDAVSVPRLPNPEHAALYHAAAVTVHPSFFEGGDAPFPFSESVSVGTPCLMARGPHTDELLAAHPELAPFVFDPYDAEALADAILRGIAQRDALLDVQLAVHERMRQRTWAQVAEEYAAAASGVPLAPVRRLAG